MTVLELINLLETFEDTLEVGVWQEVHGQDVIFPVKEVQLNPASGCVIIQN